MKIVKHKTTHEVKFFAKNIGLSSKGVTDCNFICQSVTNVDYEVIDIGDIEIPRDIHISGYNFIDDSFVVNQKGLDYQAEKQAKEGAEQSEQLKQQAQIELEKNDKVFIRHGKKGVGFNQEWRNYDDALRDVATGTSSTMPDKPSTYPDSSDVT